ncbi:DUF1003 domain-containing protein [Kaistia defluvii]|uniref:DUF1003 domain-containing protein n=1 Tax=Kaistia defluvii TaxID=410841 RepID=UPI00224E5231|nr:DUF1003 domain-containing protein [Kaistia defluvii]MCX5517077.1 DUF1003 domain-containing protein [Kaistia defluvii]
MSDAAIREFCERLLTDGPSGLSAGDRRLLEKMATRSHVARNINAEFDSQLTFGERLSDRVAAIGGSWTFIGTFAVVIIVWVVLNSLVLVSWNGVFDPYPYVFLNLVLSMVAALQAPVIMMSQNRQAEKDRMAAQHDYEVNLKAEIEILALHEKFEQVRNGELRTILERVETVLQVHLAADERAARREPPG